MRTARVICTNPASLTPRQDENPAMAAQNFNIDIDADGIVLLTWNTPGRSANLIGLSVI